MPQKYLQKASGYPDDNNGGKLGNAGTMVANNAPDPKKPDDDIPMEKAANGYEYDAYENTDADSNNQNNKPLTIESRNGEGQGGGNDVDVYNKGSNDSNNGSNRIDTDNGLSENNQASNGAVDNVETVNQANDVGINTESESSDKQESQNNAVGNENGIANGDEMGYKGEEGNILNTKNIPKLTNATDYNNYVAEIAKRQDITKDEKVRHIQEAYKLTENKADINCPIDAKYVNDISIDGDIYYNWPKFLGFIKKSISSITRENTLPKIWDRIGSLRGSNFTTLSEDGQSYTSEERSVPYIKNSDAEHNGNFKTEHYFDIIDTIINGDIETLNSIRQKQGINKKISASKFIYYQETYNQYIEWVKSEGIDINATYGLQGYAAPWKINGKIALKGGAPQFVTPFTGEILNDLGLLEIEK